ncbi:hypothetical protein DFH09DRAFT_1106504 [Mycena vulgaris]|nr:hypothetical protein DFH09DRAFT_1106504 [Mycena vulgaris]
MNRVVQIGAPSTVHRVPSRAIVCRMPPMRCEPSHHSDVTRPRAGDGSRWLTMDRQRGADLYHRSAKQKLGPERKGSEREGQKNADIRLTRRYRIGYAVLDSDEASVGGARDAESSTPPLAPRSPRSGERTQPTARAELHTRSCVEYAAPSVTRLRVGSVIPSRTRMTCLERARFRFGLQPGHGCIRLLATLMYFLPALVPSSASPALSGVVVKRQRSVVVHAGREPFLHTLVPLLQIRAATLHACVGNLNGRCGKQRPRASSYEYWSRTILHRWVLT